MRLFLLYECFSVFLVVVVNLLHCCTITTTLCFSVPFGIVVALNSAVHNKQPLQQQQQQQLMYFGISENPINPFLEIFSQTLAPSQQMQHSLCLAKELLRDKSCERKWRCEKEDLEAKASAGCGYDDYVRGGGCGWLPVHKMIIIRRRRRFIISHRILSRPISCVFLLLEPAKPRNVRQGAYFNLEELQPCTHPPTHTLYSSF